VTVNSPLMAKDAQSAQDFSKSSRSSCASISHLVASMLPGIKPVYQWQTGTHERAVLAGGGLESLDLTSASLLRQFERSHYLLLLLSEEGMLVLCSEIEQYGKRCVGE
jgi:hypothetical protein